MRKTVALITISVIGLQACVMVPSQPVPVMVQHTPGVVIAPPPGVAIPQGVVYVAPTSPAPAVGFVWEFHPRFGWGWRHPQHGWHHGWR